MKEKGTSNEKKLKGKKKKKMKTVKAKIRKIVVKEDEERIKK